VSGLNDMDYPSANGLVSGLSNVKHVTTANKVPLPPEVMENFGRILFCSIVFLWLPWTFPSSLSGPVRVDSSLRCKVQASSQGTVIKFNQNYKQWQMFWGQISRLHNKTIGCFHISYFFQLNNHMTPHAFVEFFRILRCVNMCKWMLVQVSHF